MFLHYVKFTHIAHIPDSFLGFQTHILPLEANLAPFNSDRLDVNM